MRLQTSAQCHPPPKKYFMPLTASPLTIAISAPLLVLKPWRGNNTTSAYNNQRQEDWRAAQPRKRASRVRQHDNNDGGDKVRMTGNGIKRHSDGKKRHNNQTVHGRGRMMTVVATDDGQQ